MKIIALTGGIGAGKSTVCLEFEKLGAKIIDADKISRSVMGQGQEGYNETVAYFGAGILSADGSIERGILREIVFNDKEKLKVLNNITHKYIFDRINKDIDKTQGYDIIVVDIPLLFQSEFKFNYDYSVVVISDMETRIKRVMERNGITRGEVLSIMDSQLSNEEYIKLADFCIDNNRDLTHLRNQVEILCKRILLAEKS